MLRNLPMIRQAPDAPDAVSSATILGLVANTIILLFIFILMANN